MTKTTLSSEITSLVHHIELNKVGWWERSIQRLILAVLWLAGKKLSLSEILQELNQEHLKITIGEEQAEKLVQDLCDSQMLICTIDQKYKISEKKMKDFEEELNEVHEIEEICKSIFLSLLKSNVQQLAKDETWDQFKSNFLQPLFKENGARVYEIMSGTVSSFDTNTQLSDFINLYPKNTRQALKEIIVQFLDTKKIPIREYILRHLNAYFFIEASNLDGSTLKKLTIMANLKPQFVLFIDTNYVFSLLGMHTDDSNEAAQQVSDTIRRLSDSVTVNLYILPPTVTEVKRVLYACKKSLEEIRLSPNIIEAALKTNINDIEKKFYKETLRNNCKLTVDDYFDPYIKNLINIVRDKGIELYNENIDSYRTKELVVNDILHQVEYEKKRKQVNPKSYDQHEHDITIWHFIRDKRPAFVESPIEAEYWFITEDSRFMKYDKYKMRENSNSVNICVYPTTFLQMMQLWTPRSPEFEKAILGSFILPFLFEEFDWKSEQITNKILKALSRFNNVNDLSKETISAFLLDEAIRMKMSTEKDSEKQVEIIENAFIEESRRAKQDLKKMTEEKELLLKVSQVKDQRIKKLEDTEQSYKQKQELNNKDIIEEKRRRAQLESKVQNLEKILSDSNQAKIINKEKTIFLSKCISYLLGGLLIIAIFIHLLDPHFISQHLSIYLIISCIYVSICIWYISHQGEKNNYIKDWKLFIRFLKAKKVLTGIFLAIIVTLICNILWELHKVEIMKLFRK